MESIKIKNSISRKALLFILLISSAFTLLLTAIQLHFKFTTDIASVNDKVVNAKTSAYGTITKSLWLLDDSILNLQLVGLTQIPGVAYVEVLDVGGKIVGKAGQLSEIHSKRFSYPLSYEIEQEDRVIPIGVLNLQASYKDVYNDLYKDIFIILLSQMAKTFFVSLFILLILHKLIIQHLERIVQYISSANLSGIKTENFQELELARKDRQDELDILKQTINRFYRKLNQHMNQLSSKQKMLVQEISQRKKAQQKLKDQYILSTRTLNAIQVPIISVDINGNIVGLNKSSEILFNVEINQNIKDVLSLAQHHTSDADQISVEQLLATDEEKQISGYCKITSTNKSLPVTVTIRNTILHDSSLGKTFIIVDESDTKKMEEISYNANHDLLTGLYNRHRFNLVLQDIIDNDVQPNSYAVAFIDLDNFKSINDIFGHTAGDKMITKVAQQITRFISQKDKAARFGGDEFIIIFQDSVDNAKLKISRLMDSLASIDFEQESKTIGITLSVGLTPVFVNDSVTSIIIRADNECHQVKRNGGCDISVNYKYEDSQERSRIYIDHYDTIQSVKYAIQNDFLRLYIQKITPLSNDRDLPIRGEVLVRFFDNSGEVSTGRILSVTDQYNVTPIIDLWVIETINKYIIQDMITDYKHLNINLNARSLTNQKVFNAVHILLKSCQSSGHQICFELTESSLVRNLVATERFIRDVKKEGGLFAIDDFGSGYASYGILKNLSLDILKLDGSLIRSLNASSDTKDIITSIYKVAVSLGLQTVAEHTTDEKSLAWLQSLGIDYSQSFLHGYPEPLVDNIHNADYTEDFYYIPK